MNWTALTLFAFAGAITPGPNNTLLLYSGARFGYRRTLPHLMGIWAGSILLFMCVGAGLGALLQNWPAAMRLLYAVSSLLIAYLALKIASAPFSPQAADAQARPWKARQALLFQWVNPKVWMMALGVYGSGLASENDAKAVMLIAMLNAMVCLPTMSLWTLCGTRLRRVLERPLLHRAIHVGLGGVLAGSWFLG